MSSEEHKTTDIALASALIVAGATLTGVDKIGYNQAEFILEAENVDENTLLFQNRNLNVDAMTLFETHKSLKSRANDVLRNNY